MQRPSTRRQFLAGTGLTALAVTAGCVSSSGTGPTDNETEAATSTPESLDTWFDDSNGYDGEPVKYGPLSQPVIMVGETTDGGLAFDPPVIEVSPMTNVTWDWTSHGGQQNVVALDGTFDSGRTNAQIGTSYNYIFDEVGEYPYVSEPHRDEGMKGAVIVKERESSGYPAIDQWLGSTGNFDGTITDRTGKSEATVAVGAEGNGGQYAFDPPTIKISTGTTVIWEWTGAGAAHNVFSTDGSQMESDSVISDDGSPLDSELVSEEDSTYKHTFEETGVSLYTCQPHQGLGMKGAVVVE
ncbi:halocyanin domain-containing protein [Haloarcula marismortui]|uniref:Halocyanin domain-containing protein n=1 Tax=Haloarcula marismortui ATCC 33800 TaxID=662476 RepID=A0A8T8KQ48_9EURY|nr:halocyanin domain-containing protein [Haloarcula sinaiiensis]QUJ73643.1 halocyanin domain-containing protein [Haloarcula sinaiiensis ATCC 33800]